MLNPALDRNKSHRVQAIDYVRGIVMLLMVLDHVRVYLYLGSLSNDPTNLATSTPLLFMTRWITHLCAPTFVFLAGTSAFLHGKALGDPHKLSRFLWTRGLWLVVLEYTLINFGWWFDPNFVLYNVQVIQAIGWSMVLMATLIYLPFWAIVSLGFVICGINVYLATWTFENPFLEVFWVFFVKSGFQPGGGHLFLVFYPVLPWLGIMLLGYGLGVLYQANAPYTPYTRKRILLLGGLVALTLFVLLRSANIYGDPAPWSWQKNGIFSILSFINVSKYPVSLQYALLMLGITLLLLRAFDGAKAQGLGAKVITFGRVPLFFYVLHLYLAHLAGLVGALLDGFSADLMVYTPASFQDPRFPEYGYNLGVVYGVTFLIIVLLYPVCKKYMQYKAHNRDKWWLSYL